MPLFLLLLVFFFSFNSPLIFSTKIIEDDIETQNQEKLSEEEKQIAEVKEELTYFFENKGFKMQLNASKVSDQNEIHLKFYDRDAYNKSSYFPTNPEEKEKQQIYIKGLKAFLIDLMSIQEKDPNWESNKKDLYDFLVAQKKENSEFEDKIKNAVLYIPDMQISKYCFVVVLNPDLKSFYKEELINLLNGIQEGYKITKVYLPNEIRTITISITDQNKHPFLSEAVKYQLFKQSLETIVNGLFDENISVVKGSLLDEVRQAISFYKLTLFDLSFQLTINSDSIVITMGKENLKYEVLRQGIISTTISCANLENDIKEDDELIIHIDYAQGLGLNLASLSEVAEQTKIKNEWEEAIRNWIYSISSSKYSLLSKEDLPLDKQIESILRKEVIEGITYSCKNLEDLPSLEGIYKNVKQKLTITITENRISLTFLPNKDLEEDAIFLE